MFKFRLQRLLDLRQQKEREKAAELTRAEVARDAAQRTVADMEASRAAGLERLRAQHGAEGTVGQLRNLTFVLEHLDRQLAAAAAQAEEAARQAEARRQDLTAAHTEKRVLDRLRERHESEWREDAVQADRRTMDAIALARFTNPATRRPA
jgi:flagellar FliJ protein